MSVKIGMLWMFLSDDVRANNNSLKEISTDKNVWQALKLLSMNDKTDAIFVRKGQATKKIDHASLMKAFIDYKRAN